MRGGSQLYSGHCVVFFSVHRLYWWVCNQCLEVPRLNLSWMEITKINYDAYPAHTQAYYHYEYTVSRWARQKHTAQSEGQMRDAPVKMTNTPLLWEHSFPKKPPNCPLSNAHKTSSQRSPYYKTRFLFMCCSHTHIPQSFASQYPWRATTCKNMKGIHSRILQPNG